MKNNQLKTLGLWILVIGVLFALFQSFTRSSAGRPEKFSDFIAKALPPSHLASGKAGPIGPVTVYVPARGEPFIEYDLTFSDKDSKEVTSITSKRSYWTRGDLKQALAMADGGGTLASALSARGVAVTYKDAPEDYKPKGEEVSFSNFANSVIAISPLTHVARISIQGQEITGEYVADGGKFTTLGDISYYRPDLVARGIEIVEEPENSGSGWYTLLSVFPVLIMFFIAFVLFRQMQGGGGKAMSFGKSRARLLNESSHRVTFKDVAGVDEAKEDLQEIVAFLKDPRKFTRLGGRIPKGVLLMGPPGTGKTLLAKGVAGEAGVPFFSISGSDFVEMFVGVGASRVRDLFEQGKKNAPCIIFIDEIDAVGRQRGAGMGGGHDEREQTLNQMLVEMDGFESNDGVILIAATNRPDVLDPALLRPGRFDRRVVVNRPDLKGRLDILKVHVRRARIAKDVDLAVLARATPGFAGADLENLVNEAALFAARRDKDFIEMDDFESARDKVMLGAERRSAVLTEDEKRLTAYHEAGHALVAYKLPGNDPLHKVTIIPRGMALGVTWTLPERDQNSMHEDQLLARIAMTMGGRVAEEIVFGRITTGAGNDIEQATKLARRMVCEWGMSQLGPIALTRSEGSSFLGRDFSSSEFSEKTQAEADSEIKRIINEQTERARQVLRDNRQALENFSLVLLELETLTDKEIKAAFEGASAQDILKMRSEVVRELATPEVAPATMVQPDEAADLPLPEPFGTTRSKVELD